MQAKRRRKARKDIHWHEGIPFASSALPTSLAMQLRTIVSEGEGLGLKNHKAVTTGFDLWLGALCSVGHQLQGHRGVEE